MRLLDSTMRKWSAWGMKRTMTNQVFSPSRRTLLAGIGGTALTTGLRVPALAQAGTSLALRARPGTIALGSGGSGSAVWALESANAGPLRFAKGDLAVTLSNELPAPIALNWLGIDGAAVAEPLTGQAPVPPGGRSSFTLPLRQSGTYMLSGALLGDAAASPFASRALIVEDNPPITVDRDEVFLIEEWRVKADGSAIAPGSSPEGATAAYTINGQTALDINIKLNARQRLRILNGCARTPIGLRIENHDVRVMAIDGLPSEPFLARDGQLVLAPGSRIDALIDVTRAPGTISQIILHDGTGPRTVARLIVANDAPLRPAPLPPASALPSAGLPERLNLQGALRSDLSLDPKAQWVTPAGFSAATPAAYAVKRGRTVVMAISNPTATPIAFRLHGHHFRLLDRLDDGWKPYWLDTLMVDKGQTQRIAFLAEHPGRFLMEATALNWAAPKLVRSYAVE
jgi:FtsP/CotA-like multicopper oxidase with cupredoxin domain